MADGDGPHIADLPKAQVQRQKAVVHLDESQPEDLQHPESSEELEVLEEDASSSEEDQVESSMEQVATACDLSGQPIQLR